jgi:hypothetical protein
VYQMEGSPMLSASKHRQQNVYLNIHA